MLYNGIRHTVESRRMAIMRLLIALAGALVIGMMWLCAYLGNISEQPLTMGQSATRACLTATDAKLMVGDSSFTTQLPNVGKPKAIVAVPSCFRNQQLPKTNAGYYTKYVDVYVMVSSNQLENLIGPSMRAFNSQATTEHDHPYAIEGDALKGLVTADEQKLMATDINSSFVRYWLTDGPMPTEQVDTLHGYEYTTGPRDITTDTHFMNAPFTSAVEAYGSGPVIVVTGK